MKSKVLERGERTGGPHLQQPEEETGWEAEQTVKQELRKSGQGANSAERWGKPAQGPSENTRTGDTFGWTFRKGGLERDSAVRERSCKGFADEFLQYC